MAALTSLSELTVRDHTDDEPAVLSGTSSSTWLPPIDITMFWYTGSFGTGLENFKAANEDTNGSEEN